MPHTLPLPGPSLAPADGQPPRRAVVLLHGYGADGSDLIGLAPLLANAMVDTIFLAPDAPAPCEMAPFGRQWFSLASYDPDEVRRDPLRLGALHGPMLDGVRGAAAGLNDYLDAVLDRFDLEPANLGIFGFSQGCMLGLHVALRRSQPVAALVGCSGMLVGAETLTDEISARPPVLLLHGDCDDVVPVAALEAARSGLEGAGVAVEAHVRPGLPHGIDEAGASLAARFLAGRIVAASAR